VIVVTYLGTISFEIRGQRIDEEFSQEMVDLARRQALHPEMVDRLDVNTMTIREETDHVDGKR
jgi:hypothetical protein